MTHEKDTRLVIICGVGFISEQSTPKQPQNSLPRAHNAQTWKTSLRWQKSSLQVKLIQSKEQGKDVYKPCLVSWSNSCCLMHRQLDSLFWQCSKVTVLKVNPWKFRLKGTSLLKKIKQAISPTSKEDFIYSDRPGKAGVYINTQQVSVLYYWLYFTQPEQNMYSYHVNAT